MLRNLIANSDANSRNVGARPLKRHIVNEGVVSGVFAGLVVAVWYLLCDSAKGQQFHTPMLLGSLFFPELDQTRSVAFMSDAAFAFTGLHFAAFIAFGLVTASIVAASEYEPLLLAAALIVYACYEVSFLSFVAFLDGTALGELGWWTIATANLVTVAVSAVYFQHHHPTIGDRFIRRWEEVSGYRAMVSADPARGQLDSASYR